MENQMECAITLDVDFFHYVGDTPSPKDVARVICHLLNTYPNFAGYDGIKIESVRVGEDNETQVYR
jgi:hypothetical protein